MGEGHGRPVWRARLPLLGSIPRSLAPLVGLSPERRSHAIGSIRARCAAPRARQVGKLVAKMMSGADLDDDGVLQTDELMEWIDAETELIEVRLEWRGVSGSHRFTTKITAETELIEVASLAVVRRASLRRQDREGVGSRTAVGWLVVLRRRQWVRSGGLAAASLQ